jgi:hypothetical protein
MRSLAEKGLQKTADAEALRLLRRVQCCRWAFADISCGFSVAAHSRALSPSLSTTIMKIYFSIIAAAGHSLMEERREIKAVLSDITALVLLAGFFRGLVCVLQGFAQSLDLPGLFP